MTTKKLIRRQACCIKFLSKFNFTISFTAGKNNAKVDRHTYILS